MSCLVRRCMYIVFVVKFNKWKYLVFIFRAPLFHLAFCAVMIKWAVALPNAESRMLIFFSRLDAFSLKNDFYLKPHFRNLSQQARVFSGSTKRNKF